MAQGQIRLRTCADERLAVWYSEDHGMMVRRGRARMEGSLLVEECTGAEVGWVPIPGNPDPAIRLLVAPGQDGWARAEIVVAWSSGESDHLEVAVCVVAGKGGVEGSARTDIEAGTVEGQLLSRPQ